MDTIAQRVTSRFKQAGIVEAVIWAYKKRVFGHAELSASSAKAYRRLLEILESLDPHVTDAFGEKHPKIVGITSYVNQGIKYNGARSILRRDAKLLKPLLPGISTGDETALRKAVDIVERARPAAVQQAKDAAKIYEWANEIVSLDFQTVSTPPASQDKLSKEIGKAFFEAANTFKEHLDLADSEDAEKLLRYVHGDIDRYEKDLLGPSLSL
jgi:hypothetical protein